MPKGRNFAPDGSKDGVWFHHRGLSHRYSEPPNRQRDTSSGIMMNAPYKPDSTSIPFPPPRGYLLRDSRNFKLANDFSEHNNRHLLEDVGEYFGDGQTTRVLGRRLAAAHLRQNTTPGNFLQDGFQSYVQDGTSIYTGSYGSAPPIRPLVHRRFPREYGEPSGGEVKHSTSTTHWHKPPMVPYVPPLQVLASTQEPFLKHNRWKYSYHGEPKYYPPYTPHSRRQLTCIM